jgi:hypothetical protein
MVIFLGICEGVQLSIARAFVTSGGWGDIIDYNQGHRIKTVACISQRILLATKIIILSKGLVLQMGFKQQKSFI